QHRQVRTMLTALHGQRHAVLTPAWTGCPIGAWDAVLGQVRQHVVGGDHTRGGEVRDTVLTQVATQLVLLQPLNPRLDQIHTTHRCEGFVAVAVRARVVVIPILVCFEDQVVLRIAHPWIADQLGVDLLPEQRAGVTVAGDHDPGLRIDLADRLARFQSGLRPEVVTGVVRLVHQTIAPQSRVVVNFQSDLAPGLGKRGTRNLWRVDHLAVVTVVVVHIQDDFHAVLVRQVQRLLDARQLGGIQRGAKLGLDTLPEEAQTDQLEAQLTMTLVVGLVGIGVALVVDTWNPARIEHAGREVHAYQIDTLAIARLRSRSRVRGRRRVLRLATGAAGNHGQGLRIADVAWRQLVAAEQDRQVLTDVI